MQKLKNIYVLTKFMLSFAVSLSGAFSYILYKESLDSTLVITFISIFLLALGVSALNQIQEIEEDSKMKRTSKRPLVTGAMSKIEAILISGFFILSSFALAFYLLGIKGVIIFASVVIIYNLFYTLSKKISIYAAVYGAVLGVIPPYVGWIVAGGEITDVRFIAFGLMYFIWQIPHFWLLMLKHYEDYQKGGFPTIVEVFGLNTLEKVTTVWLYFTLLSGVFCILAFNIQGTFQIIFLTILHIYLIYGILNLLKKKQYLRMFIEINIYILAITILLVLDVLF